MSGPVSRSQRLAGRIRRGGIARLRKAAGLLPLSERTSGGIPTALLNAKRRELARRRTFGPTDLEILATLLDRADAVLPLRECLDPDRPRPARLIGLRHDTDHDIEGAVRLAEWEAEHGYRSTWFVLHGDWYWGGPGAATPSRFVLRALDRIAALGHEIGLHNNAVTLALLTGEDPHRILERDLAALRRHGFDVVGSVRHGDPLCRRLGYLNSELFVECPRPDSGPTDRTLEYDDSTTGLRRQLHLRARPMAEFGLSYEANSVGQTLYQTDTGGHWGAPFDEIEGRFAAEGGFLQILVHPVWWAAPGEAVRPRPATGLEPGSATL
jgi:hypothetical protein